MFERLAMRNNARRLEKIGEAHARAVAQTLGLDGGLVLRAIATSMISLVEWGALAEQGETPAETATMWRDNLNRAFQRLEQGEGSSIAIRNAIAVTTRNS
jgi:hypothetical protein